MGIRKIFNKSIVGKYLGILRVNIKFIMKKSKSRSLSPIDKETKMGNYVKISSNCIIKRMKFIGDGTYIGNDTFIDNCEYIGKYTSIAPNVAIGLVNHPISSISTSPLFYSKSRGFINEDKNIVNNKSTKIGNDVWIGYGAIIMEGINIGNGAIVGASSIVTKDVPDYAIVVGTPAKIIKYRFEDKTINILNKSKWWDKSFEELRNIIDDMNNKEAFVRNLLSKD